MRHQLTPAVFSVAVLLVGAALAGAAAPLRVATFQCDATPPIGQPMVWDVPLKRVADRLMAKGVIIEQEGKRYVLCTLDWCELCNDSELRLRRKVAGAARTSGERVAIHVVHQHDAPYADEGAYKYLDRTRPRVPRVSDTFLDDVERRLGQAVSVAMKDLRAFDAVGTSQAVVEKVASSRRLKNADGKITVRYSAGGANPALAAAPEGEIDPYLKTITLADGKKPLVRMHFYASHPQTIQCDGRAMADFVGWARQMMEREEGVFQLYFTGCGGDVTVGKYNDGSEAARVALGWRLLAGMRASAASVRWQKADRVSWRHAECTLPRSALETHSRDYLRKLIDDPKGTPGSRIYLGAMRLSFIDRIERPLIVRGLEVGDAMILSLPGEPMLAFQKYAQGLRRDRFVALGGYCDVGPGYICTDAAFAEGGYEPSATHAGIGSEAPLKRAIREVLAAGSE